MANSPCAPFPACSGLDGRVQTRRTIYGPIVVKDKRSLPFGDYKLLGGTLRPYLDLTYETRWIDKGLCNGPVNSIMSLAPTESVTAGTRVVRRNSFSQMMTDSAESSSVSTHTRRQMTENTRTSQPGGTGGSGGIGGVGGVPGLGGLGGVLGLAEDVGSSLLDLAPISIGLFGSLFGDIVGGIADFAEGAVGAVTGVVGDIGDAIGGLVGNILGPQGGGAGGGNAVVSSTQHQIDEIIDTVEQRESQSHTQQVVVSSSVQQEEFITRTFYNPYRDRSLQLRFLPVFRTYEVITTVISARCGLALVAGNLEAAKLKTITTAVAAVQPKAGIASSAASTRATLAWAQLAHDDDQVAAPMVALLARNFHPPRESKPIFVEHALRWQEAQVRDNVLHVPAADAPTLAKALNLKKDATAKLEDRFRLLDPANVAQLVHKSTREVHVFAGTHVEAVAGECVLKNITTDALPAEKETVEPHE